jgi:hypothetical protein
LEVNPSVPVKTVPELIAYAKVNPANINMGRPASVLEIILPVNCSR